MQIPKVNVDYHIEVGRHYYSVPYAYVRKTVMVKMSESLIEVFHDHQRIAAHERSRLPFRHSTLPEHMPPEHWAYKSQSREKFLAWAAQVGPATTSQVKAIFQKKEYDEQGFRTIRGLQHLATTYGAQRLENACRKANALGIVGQRRIRGMLQAKLESEPIAQLVLDVAPVTHANVRGQEYYQSL